MGLLALLSCAPSVKKSVHEDTTFDKKIDSVQLKEQAKKLATDNTLVDALDETTEVKRRVDYINALDETTEVKRRVDYINPEANKEESVEETEEKVVVEEFNIRDHLPNHNITISFTDIDLASAFYTLASLVDRNIVIDDSVQGQLSIDLYNEPWDIAVLTIAKLKDLSIDVVLETGMLQVFSSARFAALQPPAIVEEVIAEVEEEKKIEYSTAVFNIFNEVATITATLTSLLTEDEKAMVQVLQPNEATKTLIATADDGVLDRIEILLNEIDRKVKQDSTAVFNIFFNEVEEITATLTSLLTEDEKAMVQVLQPNEATKTLIATADDGVLDRIEILLNEIDKKVKQVYFEVFIVTAQDNFAYEFGSRLGLYSTGGGGTVGGRNVNLNQVSGIVGSAPTASSDIALGTSAGSLFNGLISGTSGIGLIADVGVAKFKAELDLLESDGVSTTISNPKILLTNGKTGNFKQIVQYTTLTQPTEGEPEQISGEAGLILSLTPYIGNNNQIKLKYYLEDSSVGTAVAGQVPDKTKTAIGSESEPIEMFIQNKQIMVLGGLYTSTATDSSSGVPGAKRVPVIRWFTSNKEMKDEQKELLFFIIPTII